MSDSEFVEDFRSGRLSPAAFDHEAHLRAACLLLETQPFLEACISMRDGLRCIAQKAGKPDLYHETITVAFMAIVADKMSISDGGWRVLLANHPELSDRDLLHSFYSKQSLDSTKARKTFVLPDRAGVAE
jgi:hypothetical protein